MVNKTKVASLFGCEWFFFSVWQSAYSVRLNVLWKCTITFNETEPQGACKHGQFIFVIVYDMKVKRDIVLEKEEKEKNSRNCKH